jgi:hypothetical protein
LLEKALQSCLLPPWFKKNPIGNANIPWNGNERKRKLYLLVHILMILSRFNEEEMHMETQGSKQDWHRKLKNLILSNIKELERTYEGEQENSIMQAIKSKKTFDIHKTLSKLLHRRENQGKHGRLVGYSPGVWSEICKVTVLQKSAIKKVSWSDNVVDRTREVAVISL